MQFTLLSLTAFKGRQHGLYFMHEAIMEVVQWWHPEQQKSSEKMNASSSTHLMKAKGTIQRQSSKWTGRESQI